MEHSGKGMVHSSEFREVLEIQILSLPDYCSETLSLQWAKDPLGGFALKAHSQDLPWRLCLNGSGERPMNLRFESPRSKVSAD